MIQTNNTTPIDETDGLPMPRRIWAVVSIGFALCMSVLDVNIINIVLLVLVKLVGVSVNGAQRWINLGFTRLQPSELTKIIMIIFVAVYIQEH